MIISEYCNKLILFMYKHITFYLFRKYHFYNLNHEGKIIILGVFHEMKKVLAILLLQY